MLENGIKSYIEKRLQEEGRILSKEELEALTNGITCTVADTIDQELEDRLD